MLRGDAGLQLVPADPALRHRPAQPVYRGVDRRPVPARPVLLLQRHQPPPRVEAGGRPRLVELQQRGQPADLGLPRHEYRQLPGQRDRLAGEVASLRGGRPAGQVPLVEDQVHHGEHGRQPGRVVVRVGQVERHLPVGQYPPGAHQPLRDRRLGYQVGGGDLRGGQAADGAQRQRYLGGDRQCRMAAAEHQHQPVLVGRLPRGRLRDQQRGELVPAGGLAAQPVQGAPPGGGDQPAGRAVRYPIDRPPAQRLGQRVLQGVLGPAEVPEPPGEYPEHAGRVGTPHPVHRRLGVHGSSLPAPTRPGRDAS